jgi:hypothetical protein
MPGIPYNIEMVDMRAHLMVLGVRMARFGGIELAIDKAVTARFFDKTTSLLASLSQSGKPPFGIQDSNAWRPEDSGEAAARENMREMMRGENPDACLAYFDGVKHQLHINPLETLLQFGPSLEIAKEIRRQISLIPRLPFTCG